jgi:regulation of enolase protein 1 (concanavalin A-like superfamily)
LLTPSDQAQLLVYLSPTEWVKTGAEYDNDALWHGVVVCNPFSDW